MRLSGIDVEPLGPGGSARVVEFVPTGWEVTRDDRELTFDERNHLSGARRGGWLAAVLRIKAPWDEKVLARTVEAFVTRHPTLHRLPGLAGSYRMTSLPRHEARPILDASPQALEALLDDACAPALDDDGVPLGPAYRFLAWESPAMNDAQREVTIVAAFDHVHVDAWSMQLTVRDLESLYLAAVQDDSATTMPSEPGGERLVEHAPSPSRPDVEAGMARWHAFLDDGGLPVAPFPLDDAPAPDGADKTTTPGLVTRTATFALDPQDRSQGSVLPATLGALARAVHLVSGERRFRALLPVHTRRAPGSDELLGWHVTNTPLTFDVEAPSDDVRAAVRAAVACASVDLAAMLSTYPGDVALGPLFTVSFLDYRRVPGHDAAQRTDAVQVSGRGPGSGVQLWFARTDDALHLRCRHPATAVADRHVTALLAYLEGELTDEVPVMTRGQ